VRLLGAVLAGGQSRRFGSDKAAALLDGRALMDHVIARLAPQSAGLVIVGRVHDTLPSLTDAPAGGQGPLAGLNAALCHAAAHGYDAVLSVPCDVPDLPGNVATLLMPGPAVLADQPVIGLWPAELAPMLGAWLAGGGRAVRGFAEHAAASETDGRADEVLRVIYFTAWAPHPDQPQPARRGSGKSPLADALKAINPGDS
jgi:molybdenum cofactor guanylyltransferase